MVGMGEGQPHPSADEPREERTDGGAVPDGADPRRLHTDPEFDEDGEPAPPDAAERGDIP
jgi:hypothetical protein